MASRLLTHDVRSDYWGGPRRQRNRPDGALRNPVALVNNLITLHILTLYTLPNIAPKQDRVESTLVAQTSPYQGVERHPGSQGSPFNEF